MQHAEKASKAQGQHRESEALQKASRERPLPAEHFPHHILLCHEQHGHLAFVDLIAEIAGQGLRKPIAGSQRQ